MVFLQPSAGFGTTNGEDRTTSLYVLVEASVNGLETKAGFDLTEGEDSTMRSYTPKEAANDSLQS